MQKGLCGPKKQPNWLCSVQTTKASQLDASIGFLSLSLAPLFFLLSYSLQTAPKSSFYQFTFPFQQPLVVPYGLLNRTKFCPPSKIITHDQTWSFCSPLSTTVLHTSDALECGGGGDDEGIPPFSCLFGILLKFTPEILYPVSSTHAKFHQPHLHQATPLYFPLIIPPVMAIVLRNLTHDHTLLYVVI